jgi:hypothetical protein
MPYKKNSDIPQKMQKSVATAAGIPYKEPEKKVDGKIVQGFDPSNKQELQKELTRFREVLAKVMKEGIQGQKVPEGRAIAYALGTIKKINK